jgi:serine/threonine-protein kinase
MLCSLMAEKLIEGRVIAGRFRLDRELGRGGMGTVWEARHLSLETQVAIKFLKSELSQREDIRQRFAREATSAARIRSPHVVGVLDSGFTEDDFAFIVMELLHGEDLGRRLARVGVFTLEETRRLVSQVARGLSKAHAVGIVHRDLKPENLFVVDDDEASVKILDFGIAKAFGPEAATHKTDTGQLLGTPTYMSPEQALGRAVDSRSDLYSLAVVAYRCLAGRTPFDHAAPGEMIVAVSIHVPPPPSTFNPRLSPATDAWFAQMLAKEPDQRCCQTAAQLGEAFEQLCADAAEADALHPAHRRAGGSARSLPGATLSDAERPPSAEEVATTVLVPSLPPLSKAKLPRFSLIVAGSLMGAAAAFALAPNKDSQLERRLVTTLSTRVRASLSERRQGGGSASATIDSRAGLGTAPPPPLVGSDARKAPLQATAAKPPKLPPAPASAPNAGVEPASSPNREPVVASPGEPAIASEKTARERPPESAGHGLGIDRGSPW